MMMTRGALNFRGLVASMSSHDALRKNQRQHDTMELQKCEIDFSNLHVYQNVLSFKNCGCKIAFGGVYEIAHSVFFTIHDFHVKFVCPHA